ncbi:hypothetical protein KJ972_02695 [Candidatus Micrarchaeota archaeon]|nr:hypothetical protein [Candidatus Micrarchaeota archaeon]
MQTRYWFILGITALLFLVFALSSVSAHPITVRYSHYYTTPQYYGPSPSAYRYDSFVQPVRYPTAAYSGSTYYPSAYYYGGTYYNEYKFKIPKPFPVLRYVYRQLNKYHDD